VDVALVPLPLKKDQTGKKYNIFFTANKTIEKENNHTNDDTFLYR